MAEEAFACERLLGEPVGWLPGGTASSEARTWLGVRIAGTSTDGEMGWASARELES